MKMNKTIVILGRDGKCYISRNGSERNLIGLSNDSCIRNVVAFTSLWGIILNAVISIIYNYDLGGRRCLNAE